MSGGVDNMGPCDDPMPNAIFAMLDSSVFPCPRRRSSPGAKKTSAAGNFSG
jgi:hypothetical protein